MKISLLEYIYNHSDVEFLSDLRVKGMIKKSIPIIQNIRESQFSLDEWKYFYLYLTNHTLTASTINEAKESVIYWITRAGR